MSFFYIFLTYVLWGRKNQLKCENLDYFLSVLYEEFKVDIGYISGTTYKNQMRGINNMLSSLKRRKVNALLKKSYVLINFSGNSFSLLTVFVKNGFYEKY